MPRQSREQSILRQSLCPLETGILARNQVQNPWPAMLGVCLFTVKIMECKLEFSDSGAGSGLRSGSA